MTNPFVLKLGDHEIAHVGINNDGWIEIMTFCMRCGHLHTQGPDMPASVARALAAELIRLADHLDPQPMAK